MANLKLRITVDPETGKLVAFNDELGKMPGAANKASSGLTSSFLKAQVVMEGIKLGIGKAVDAFKDGIAEIEKDSAGLARLKGAAESMVVPFQSLVDVTNKISSDNLIDFSSAAESIANITQAGLGKDLEQVAIGLKDIAAAAGGNVAENMERLTTALLTGKTNGAELQKMLPSLRGEMDKLPKSASDAEKQQALLNAILKDSATQAGAAKDKLGELDGQMQVLKNTTDDLKKAWAEGLLKGFTVTSEQMGGTTKTMGELSVAVEGLGTVISVALVGAFKLFKANIDFLMTPLNQVIETFVALPGYIRELSAPLDQLTERFRQAGQGMVDAFGKGLSEKWEALKNSVKQNLQALRDLLPSSDAKTGPLSTLTAAGAALWATFAGGMKSTEGVVLSMVASLTSKISGYFGMIGDAISRAGDIFGDFVSAIGTGFSSVGQAMAGFQQIMKGGFQNIMSGISMVISAAVALFNVFKKLFSHDWAKDVRDVINGLSLSADLMQQIAQDAEKYGDAGVAVWKNLSAIIAEVGTQAIPLLRNGFSYLEQGIITTQQLIDGLNENFRTLADASMNSLGMISDEMREIIALAKQFGLEVEAITDFLNEQFQSQVEAINNLFGNTKIDTEREFERMQMILLTSINAMLASGMSIAEIVTLLGPAFASVAEAAERLGVAGNIALAPFLEFQKIMEQFPKATQNIMDVVTVMTTLHNTNSLTEEGFKALERTGTKAARRIMQDGQLSAGEWAAIQPYIQTVMELAEKYGFTLDKNTQAIIDQAIANGYLTASDPTEDMESGFQGIVREMGKLNDTFEAFINYLMQATGWAYELGGAMGSIPPPPGTPGSGNRTGSGPSPGFVINSGPSYQGITQPHYVSGTERNVTLHSGEAVLPAGWMQKSGSTRVVSQQPIIFQVSNRTLAEIILEVSADGTINAMRTA